MNIMAQDLKEKSTTKTKRLEGIEVDGMDVGVLYTPAQISEKVASRTTAYSSCQRCVFSQCVYSRT